MAKGRFFALFRPVAALKLGEACLQITYLFRLAADDVYQGDCVRCRRGGFGGRSGARLGLVRPEHLALARQ